MGSRDSHSDSGIDGGTDRTGNNQLHGLRPVLILAQRRRLKFSHRVAESHRVWHRGYFLDTSGLRVKRVKNSVHSVSLCENRKNVTLRFTPRLLRLCARIICLINWSVTASLYERNGLLLKEKRLLAHLASTRQKPEPHTEWSI